VVAGSVGPGTLLAGRYRLDDLLAESRGARFWRATDTILARNVAIHAVPSDDPRAAGLLAAARLSATVVDPHLLRVLDCDDDNGITWVVNEWGEGISLDLMLQQGTLPPSRAAWLTREVAEAIAAGHAQGVAHGRLNPEAVLVTHAGAVKLIGYVVDASLEKSREPDPMYGELDEREADVINLAGILYAALTGRWPGVARSAVPQAPREGQRPLRPRQVRAGVPRTLDAICDRVLHKEASQHALPIETAHEIAAALADYVGDPALTAPVDAAGMHAEPQVSGRDMADPDMADPEAADPEAADPDATVAVTTDPDATQVVARDPEATRVIATDPEATRAVAPLPAQAGGPGTSGQETQTFRPPQDGPDSLAPLHPPAEDTPPSPFPDIPERPLFATTERRVPATARVSQGPARSSVWATDQTGTTDPAETTGHSGAGAAAHSPARPLGAGWSGPAPDLDPGRTDDNTSAGSGNGKPDFWPFTGDPEEENEVHTGKEGRGWLRTAVVIGVLLVLLIAMVVAFNRGRQDGSLPFSGSGADPTGTTQAATGAAVELAAVQDFDPEADPPEENPERAADAIDGDPATSWITSTYRGDAALGGLKPGVGLQVDLGKDVEARSVSVRFKGSPTSFEVYAAPAGVTDFPESLDQMEKVAERANAPERARVALEPAAKTRFLLVWLTELPAVSGGFRGEITDITVTS